MRIWIHLGCGEAEKQNAQLVSFNINLSFKVPPIAIVTDQLDDTVCYLKLTQTIQNLCQNKRFNLIEHLVYDVHQAVVERLENNSQNITDLKVTVNKLAPPVPGIHGGVSFTYSGGKL